jgi:hypothetical protein
MLNSVLTDKANSNTYLKVCMEDLKMMGLNMTNILLDSYALNKGSIGYMFIGEEGLGKEYSPNEHAEVFNDKITGIKISADDKNKLNLGIIEFFYANMDPKQKYQTKEKGYGIGLSPGMYGVYTYDFNDDNEGDDHPGLAITKPNNFVDGEYKHIDNVHMSAAAIHSGYRDNINSQGCFTIRTTAGKTQNGYTSPKPGDPNSQDYAHSAVVKFLGGKVVYDPVKKTYSYDTKDYLNKYGYLINLSQ